MIRIGNYIITDGATDRFAYIFHHGRIFKCLWHWLEKDNLVMHELLNKILIVNFPRTFRSDLYRAGIYRVNSILTRW